MPYKLNLFRLNPVSGDWFFVGKYTPDVIAKIESCEPDVVFLSSGW